MAKYLEVAGKADRGLNWDSVRDEPYPGVKIFSGFNSSTVISRFGIDISSPRGRLSDL